MANQNQCNFTGRLGRNIELSYSKDGLAIGKGSMAVSKKYKDQEKTTWINLVFFGKSAEIVEKYTKKGSLLRISAEYQSREYEQDGQKKYFSEFLVNDFEFLGGKEEGRPEKQEKEYPKQNRSMPEDDIPF